MRSIKHVSFIAPAAKRLGAVAVSAALVASVMSMSAAVAEEVAPATAPDSALVEPVDSDDDGVLDAPTASAASAGAVAADEPVEVLAERTENSTTVANVDGSYTLTQYGTVQRVKQDAEWVDVDYFLEQRSDGSYAPKVSPTAVVIGGGGSSDVAKVSFGDGRTVQISWPADLPEPTIDGATATYALSTTTDLVVTAVESGVTTHMVIKAAPASDDVSFTMGLTTKDLTLTETAQGGIQLSDDGQRIGAVSSMVAWDSEIDAAGDRSDIVEVESSLDVTSQSGPITEHELDLSTPSGFLSAADTVYPVVIDPDLQNLTEARDTWVREGDTSTRNLEDRLIVGKVGGAGNTNPAMSYLQFYTPTGAPSKIVSADLNLFQYYAAICSPRKLVARPVADIWRADIVYSNRPSVRTGTDDVTTMTANRGSGCTPGSGITQVDVTEIARAWANNHAGSGGYDNRGVRLDVGSDNGNDSSYERRFCSFAAGRTTQGDDPVTQTTTSCNSQTRQPTLTVTYNSPPVTPTKPDVTFGGNPVTVTTKVQDSNAETNLRAKIVVKRDGAQVWSGDTTAVAVSASDDAPKIVSARLPYLPDGDYTVTAQAFDQLNTPSAVSSSTAFTVDTEFGSQGYYATTQHQLGDRSSIQVNNRTGNVAVQANDVNVNGIGVDLGLTRFYNSQSTQFATQPETVQNVLDEWATSMGNGWSLSAGPDVWLEKRGDTFWYHAPGGTVFGPFRPNESTSDPDDFTKPKGGVDADLTRLSSTSASDYRLAFRHSQTRYDFEAIGSDGDAFQEFSRDRSGNKIEFFYSGTVNNRPKLASIKDSSNRSYGVTYTGNYITKIAESGTNAREWEYGYGTNGDLLTYSDAANNVTNYTYSTATATNSRPLQKIEDPQNQSGTRPTTTFEYFGAGLNLDRGSKVQYAKASGTAEYTWDYSRSNGVARCNERSQYSTNVVDKPSANSSGTTSYCFKNAGTSATDLANVRVYDALGHVKQTEYTADMGSKSLQSAGNSAATGGNGSTVAEYGAITDQLSSVQEPKSGGAETRGTSSFKYGAGEPYQPSQTTDGNGQCSSFTYDGNGRTTSAYTGLKNDAAGSCDKAGKTGFHREYNDNGTLHESWDANAGDSPSSDEKTVYSYFDDGNDIGQLKTVRKPGGSCDAPRKLCTSYTYDGRGRVKTVTDGRGKVTIYSYDALDRTIQVDLDGAVSCPSSKCVKYTYDAEGNMTQRIDKSGTTTSRYDRMNRLEGQTLPDGTIIAMTYDDNGNLLTHSQQLAGQSAPDTTSYKYDEANRLKKVTDASGAIDLTVDDDGRTTKVAFPGNGQTNVNYDFTKSGKPKSVEVKNGTTSKRKIAYDYTKTVTVPIPVGPGLVVQEDISIESNQIQGRDTTKTPDDTAEGNLDLKYDDDQRLKWAHNTNGALPDYDYSYDPVGNITKEKKDADSTYYGYDLAGQLCWKDSSEHADDDLHTNCLNVDGATNYVHDAAGNNLGTSTDTRTYNDNSQLTSIGGVDMEYSDLGNPVRTQAGTTSFVNSPLGVTAKKIGSAITYYTRDPNGQILSSHGAGGTVNYVSEYNGSVMALYTPAGTEVGSYRYSPYGETAVDNNGTTSTAAADNPFRYIGGYQDKTSTGDDGYYKLGARYYDGHGHFTQPDAIAGRISDPRTLTSYNYAGGDPINSSDPSGNSFEDAFRGLGEVSGAMDVIDLGNAVAEGDASEILAKGSGLLTEGAVTAGCTALTGPSVIGFGYCWGVSSMIGSRVETGVRDYGKSADW